MDFCGCSPWSALLANHYLSFEVPAEISCETLSIPLRISPGVPIAMALWVILEIHQRVPLEMVSEVSPKVQKGVFSENYYKMPIEIPSVPAAILLWKEIHLETITLREGNPRSIPEGTRRGINEGTSGAIPYGTSREIAEGTPLNIF